jgi:general secretion pathway protein G
VIIPQSIKNRGFTLIELLVVISIIGLLSSIVLSTLSDVKAKARDARRISDIKQIQNALELYRNDTGSYPTFQDHSYAMANSISSLTKGGWDTTLKNALVSKYISELPTDPKPTNGIHSRFSGVYGYTYYTMSTEYQGCQPGQWYFIFFRMEKDTSNETITMCNGTILSAAIGVGVGIKARGMTK